MMFRICEYCGAHLDPGEKCDCRERAEHEREVAEQMLVKEKTTGQMAFKLSRERRRA